MSAETDVNSAKAENPAQTKWTPQSTSHPRNPFGLLPDSSDRLVDSPGRDAAAMPDR